jgi:predicted HAD superfamily phosphohydrolase
VARISGILVLLMSFTLVTGCDVFKTEKDEILFNKIEELQLQIQEEQWDEALSNMNEFKKVYGARKWKMQLLGELEDYKDIELEMELFKESVKDQDELESKRGLSQIKHRLIYIYNL